MKLLSIITLSTLTATAVQASIFEPAPVKLGDGFSIVPQLETDVYSNSNLYTDESDANSSIIYVVEPSMTFGVDDGINRYGGNYALTSGSYSYDNDDNYLDHDFNLFGHTEFTERHRTDIGFGFVNKHENRGSGYTEDDASTYDEPLKYNQLFGKLYYQYGVATALVNLGGGVRYDVREYQNFTSDTEENNFDKLTLSVDAEYQIGAITYLTADFNRADIKYKYDDTKDNINNVWTVGGYWKGTGKTVGSAKFGYQYKAFDDASNDDFSGSTVDLGIGWKPIEYSNFELHFVRSAEESGSDSDADYILTNAGSLNWEHNWNEKIDSNVGLVYRVDDYVGLSRKDTTGSVSVALIYEITRWMKVRSGYQFTNKNSTASDISYDRNLFNLGLTVAL